MNIVPAISGAMSGDGSSTPPTSSSCLALNSSARVPRITIAKTDITVLFEVYGWLAWESGSRVRADVRYAPRPCLHGANDGLHDEDLRDVQLGRCVSTSAQVETLELSLERRGSLET